MSQINRIEVSFAVTVELNDTDRRELHQLVSSIVERHQPDGHVHWLAGTGSKPNFSSSDSVFLGRQADSTNVPADGEEPTWDDSVYYLETCCREK